MTPYVKAILVKARARLDEQGWCQGAYIKGLTVSEALDEPASAAGKCMCSMGAIGFVAGQHPIAWALHPVYEALNAALPKRWRLLHPRLAVVRYNDARQRTKAQILALFDKAIANAD